MAGATRSAASLPRAHRQLAWCPPAGHGAGLGLAISRQLVRLMDGEIQVASKPGKGSRFWFELELPNLDAEIAAPAADRTVTGYEGPRKKVLVVDDVPVIAVSASTSTDGRALALAAGANVFLAKPIELSGLLKVMGELLGLTWIHRPAGSEAALEGTLSGSLAPPPPEELRVLHELARRGNMRQIRERADHLASLGETCRPFAEKLRWMADQCQSEAILALLKQHMNRETNLRDPKPTPPD